MKMKIKITRRKEIKIELKKFFKNNSFFNIFDQPIGETEKHIKLGKYSLIKNCYTLKSIIKNHSILNSKYSQASS